MPAQRLPRQTGLSAIKSVRYRRFPVVDVSTGGGSTTYNQYVSFFEKVGPSSYDATNGIVLDFSATYSSLNDVRMYIKKGARGVLPACRFRYVLDSPTAGKCTVFIGRLRSQNVSSFGNVQNQPGGVTVEAASGVATTAEAAHVHTLDHDHVSQNSAASANSGAGVNSALTTLNQNVSTHIHGVDVPNLVVNTGAGSSHSHVDSNIYQHQHVATLTPTSTTVPTLANATNIATTIWLGYVTGVRL